MKKNIQNNNDKGQLHGYQEWYNYNGKLRFRCVAKNNKPIGYRENNYFDGIGDDGTEVNFHIR